MQNIGTEHFTICMDVRDYYYGTEASQWFQEMSDLISDLNNVMMRREKDLFVIRSKGCNICGYKHEWKMKDWLE